MEDNKSEHIYEIRLAFMIAVLAAILSVIDIGAGKFGDDELVSVSKKMSAYELYHTKVLKETLIEGERNLLADLVKAGAIVPKDSTIIKKRLSEFDNDLTKIKAQQKEISEGSKKVGKENWSQPDIKGKLGNIKGVEEWEKQVETLGVAGDAFDLSSLFVELSLVIGAMGIISKTKKVKSLFMYLMIFFGGLGTIFGIYAYFLALTS
ncbi:MAG: DUF4337 family protein [Bacteroidetes bacterium]|nr:MAG: DUF4337 family protein [Bacteroidota bacterium]